jgi:hypothetical protein
MMLAGRRLRSPGASLPLASDPAWLTVFDSQPYQLESLRKEYQSAGRQLHQQGGVGSRIRKPTLPCVTGNPAA